MTVDWPEIYPVEIAGKLPVCFECGIPGCSWRTYHKDRASADKERQRHAINTCPMELQIDMSIISELWDEVDNVVTYLRATDDPKDSPDYLKAQGKAQGVAIAIYLMSRPHFPDAQAVAKHAGLRFKARIAEQPMPETPGVNGHNPLPATIQKRKVAAEVRKVAEVEAAESATANIPADVKAMVVNANKAKLPIDSIVKVTKLSKAQVEVIIAAADTPTKIDAT